MTIRFLHTGDWHLGMTRYFLSEGNQERFSQARFDVIRKLGMIAIAENCEFMVVCGDVFESNQVDPRTVRRALEALKTLQIPVYLLPGNHDPLDAASVYNSNTFKNGKPDHVHVLMDSNPIRIKENVEIVGAPWLSKYPTHDNFALATDKLQPDDDIIRICVAHGAIRDKNSPNPDNPVLISFNSAEQAISQGKIHYLALGDRHSLTEVGDSGRIWYAGSPEPTSFKEEKPGFAIVASVGKDTIATKELRTGRWRFDMCERIDLNSGEDLKDLEYWFTRLEDKEQRIVKLHLMGSLSLVDHSVLNNLLERMKDLLGAIEVNRDDLIIRPTSSDFDDLGFSGYVSKTVDRLQTSISKAGAESTTSLDALALLHRLSRRDQ